MAAENEHPNHEAVLTGTIALASLFSSCVEAFGLIHPSHKWEKNEQLLLASLGIQQARLLIWGDVVGVSSPPASVTDRAVPKHPSAAYPDLKEPTFFNARDPRLDETETRKDIENALSALIDRSAGHSREEMMAKYGLKPPKKFSTEYQPTLDTNRLESFRERYELLKEVAETYAQINTRRQSSITATSWAIQDYERFRTFVKLTQEKVDHLIHLMDVNDRVDRAMRMDIKALGWHLSADRARVALDVSKLKLIQEASKDEYPVYVEATKQALDNIERERRENAADYNPYAAQPFAPVATPRIAPPPRSGRGSIAAASGETANGTTNGAGAHKRHSLFGSLFRRKSSSHVEQHPRSLSVASGTPSRPSEPVRATSDVGPLTTLQSQQEQPAAAPPQPDPVTQLRSKSIGDILDAPVNSEDEEMIKHRLEKLSTNANPSSEDPVEVERVGTNLSAISAHDQYHGLGRQATKTQW